MGLSFLICKGWASSVKDPSNAITKKNICKIPQRVRHALISSFLSPLLSADTAHIPCGGEDWPCSLRHGQGKAMVRVCCALGLRPRRALF